MVPATKVGPFVCEDLTPLSIGQTFQGARRNYNVTASPFDAIGAGVVVLKYQHVLFWVGSAHQLEAIELLARRATVAQMCYYDPSGKLNRPGFRRGSFTWFGPR